MRVEEPRNLAKPYSDWLVRGELTDEFLKVCEDPNLIPGTKSGWEPVFPIHFVNRNDLALIRRAESVLAKPVLARYMEEIPAPAINTDSKASGFSLKLFTSKPAPSTNEALKKLDGKNIKLLGESRDEIFVSPHDEKAIRALEKVYETAGLANPDEKASKFYSNVQTACRQLVCNIQESKMPQTR